MTNRDRTWKVAADEYIRWVRANGRLPKRTETDWVEGSRARWMRTQQSNTRMSDKRRRYLDKFTPGWDSIRRRPPAPGWEARFTGCRDWVAANRGRPGANSFGEEMRVYRWLYRQAQYLPVADPRRDRLVGAFPDWDRVHGWWPPQVLRARDIALWEAKFEKHTALVATNGTPTQRSSPEGRQAYLWLWKQPRDLPAGDPRRDRLAGVLPGWDPVHGWW